MPVMIFKIKCYLDEKLKTNRGVCLETTIISPYDYTPKANGDHQWNYNYFLKALEFAMNFLGFSRIS